MRSLAQQPLVGKGSGTLSRCIRRCTALFTFVSSIHICSAASFLRIPFSWEMTDQHVNDENLYICNCIVTACPALFGAMQHILNMECGLAPHDSFPKRCQHLDLRVFKASSVLSHGQWLLYVVIKGGSPFIVTPFMSQVSVSDVLSLSYGDDCSVGVPTLQRRTYILPYSTHRHSEPVTEHSLSPISPLLATLSYCTNTYIHDMLSTTSTNTATGRTGSHAPSGSATGCLKRQPWSIVFKAEPSGAGLRYMYTRSTAYDTGASQVNSQPPDIVTKVANELSRASSLLEANTRHPTFTNFFAQECQRAVSNVDKNDSYNMGVSTAFYKITRGHKQYIVEIWSDVEPPPKGLRRTR